MDNLFQDLRYAFRTLIKRPGFTVVAVLALALGIGANTAIFSVVNGVILRPLPYTEPDRLAMVWLDNRRQGIREDITSYPNFIDWRDQNQVFEGMAGFRSWRQSLTGTGEPEELRGASVSANFFQIMGTSPSLGRGFTAEEETPGKDNVVILSHGLWQRRFGGDSNLLGRTLTLGGRIVTVVGVMPVGFQFPKDAEMWDPLAPSERLKAARSSFWLPVIGRLRPGVTPAQAQAEMDTIAGRLEQQYPESNAGYGINIVPLHDQVVGKVRPALLVLLASVAFVLLIACANVANLLLARAAERQKEIAIRTALGAGRWRIIRQMLTESLLLAALGGGLGLMLATLGVDALVAISPADLPRMENADLDVRVLGFTLFVSLLTGFIFGLVPALQASKPELNETLKEGGRTETGGVQGQRIRSLLVVFEMAIALMLLIGAGLMIRSFQRVYQVDLGFNSDRLLTVGLSLPRSKYADGASLKAFYKQLEERLAAVPGVESVGSTSQILLPELTNSTIFSVEGRAPEPEAQRLEVPYDTVTPDYFKTMGMALAQGRTFTEQDGPDAEQVVVINEAMARRYWPDTDPVGKRFKYGDPDSNSPWMTVVGVVRDTRRQGLDRTIRIESYLPYAQAPFRSMYVVVRAAGDPLALASTLRDTVWSLDKDLPVANIQTMEQILSETTAQRRLNMLLMGLFAAVALILAAVGIYGVMSYSVTRRTREIGIRQALGATRRDVLRMIIKQGMIIAFAGVVIGLAASFALTRVMSSLLFEVSATDAFTFAVTSLALAGVALLASYIPAHRATRVDPMVALRYE
ncbi:MAG: ABC transporter permease [Blastocatellia bacterium]|nr:ABC transporter permease [Blastocatellia bacterium]